MADSPTDKQTVPVVTLRTLQRAGALESSGLENNQDPKQRVNVDRYNSVLEKLQVETAKAGSNVLITVQDRDASILQSRIAEAGEAGPPLPAGGLEAQFGDGIA